MNLAVAARESKKVKYVFENTMAEGKKILYFGTLQGFKFDYCYFSQIPLPNMIYLFIVHFIM
jgi:hypothetical protein